MSEFGTDCLIDQGFGYLLAAIHPGESVRALRTHHLAQ
ncbi:hypothetical protein Thiosp_01700 [Thiorhodovibrio litoralis]|nr:hypothetical protein Thiosp_01700 [Thiorhodovibrio litoralis]